MSGMGAFILKNFGAFIRWAFTGFRGSYKLLAEGTAENNMKNDVKNIIIALLFFFVVMALIQYFFF